MEDGRVPQLAARHLARHDDPARRTRCILLTITRRRWKALPDAERHRFEQRVALLERSAWAPASAPCSFLLKVWRSSSHLLSSTTFKEMVDTSKKAFPSFVI